MAFIEFQCPNEPAEGKRMQCRRTLFGVELGTVAAHDFALTPFVDYRFCPSCGIMYRITIDALDGTPVMDALPAGARVTGVPAEEYFGAVRVEGDVPRAKAGAA